VNVTGEPELVGPQTGPDCRDGCGFGKKSGRLSSKQLEGSGFPVARAGGSPAVVSSGRWVVFGGVLVVVVGAIVDSGMTCSEKRGGLSPTLLEAVILKTCGSSVSKFSTSTFSSGVSFSLMKSLKSTETDTV